MSNTLGNRRRDFLRQSVGGLAALSAVRGIAACSAPEDGDHRALEDLLGAFGRYEPTGDGRREIFSDGDPLHATGIHTGFMAISTDLNVQFRAPAEPQAARRLIPLELVREQDGGPADYEAGVFDASANRLAYNFGVGVNGIPFDPRGPWYQSNPELGWHFNLLKTEAFVDIGMDANCAHTHFGTYHYHGVPWGLVRVMRDLEFTNEYLLIGLAADGFPIYFNAAVDSSYVLRKGTRPGEGGPGAQPGGAFDGAFEEDFEYDPSAGPLDESNSMYIETPEYPDGVEAYFITRSFPGVPRYLRGVPDLSFMHEETSGCAPMPPAFWGYGGLSDEEIEAAQQMSQCDTLPGGAPGGVPPDGMAPTPVEGVPEAYTSHCASCHGAEAATLDGVADSHSLTSFEAFLRGSGRGDPMPTYDTETLSRTAIEEIYDYLRSR